MVFPKSDTSLKGPIRKGFWENKKKGSHAKSGTKKKEPWCLMNASHPDKEDFDEEIMCSVDGFDVERLFGGG